MKKRKQETNNKDESEKKLKQVLMRDAQDLAKKIIDFSQKENVPTGTFALAIYALNETMKIYLSIKQSGLTDKQALDLVSKTNGQLFDVVRNKQENDGEDFDE